MSAERRYLLDTNAVSWFVRNPSVPLEARISGMARCDFCVSAITEGELRYGLARRPRATALARAVEALLVRVDVLPWDASVARRHGDLRATLETAGTPLAALDTLIAAHALSAGAILVTHDQAFARVPDLTIEDWQV